MVLPSPSNALVGGGARQRSPSRRNTDRQTYLWLLVLHSFLFLPIYFLCERPVVGRMGIWGERGQRHKRGAKEGGGRIKIKTTVCSPSGSETLPFTGWHSLTIPVPWQPSARSLWTTEQLQAAPTWDQPCTEQDEAQHTLRLPLHTDWPRLSSFPPPLQTQKNFYC